jgi:hypothetical protein
MWIETKGDSKHFFLVAVTNNPSTSNQNEKRTVPQLGLDPTTFGIPTHRSDHTAKSHPTKMFY